MGKRRCTRTSSPCIIQQALAPPAGFEPVYRSRAASSTFAVGYLLRNFLNSQCELSSQMPDLEVSRGFASIPTPGGIIANPGEWRVNGFYYSAVVLIWLS